MEATIVFINLICKLCKCLLLRRPTRQRTSDGDQ